MTGVECFGVMRYAFASLDQIEKPLLDAAQLRNSIINVSKKTSQAEGRDVKVWDAFSSFGIGPLVKVDGKFNSVGYMQLVKEHVLPYLTDLELFINKIIAPFIKPKK